MGHDRKQIEQLARTYTEAWCSRDPARVAAHYVPGGMIAESRGHYDQAEYDRQVQHGIGPPV